MPLKFLVSHYIISPSFAPRGTLFTWSEEDALWDPDFCSGETLGKFLDQFFLKLGDVHTVIFLLLGNF